MTRFFALLVLLACFSALPARAGEVHAYRDGDTVLEGYMARSSQYEVGPAVLIVHQWKGLGDYERRRADMLAALGYHAFAVDMYGQGVRPKDNEEAGRLAGKFKSDPGLARRRLAAAVTYVKSLYGVNDAPVVIIGYCFGGTMALEQARAGADLAGVASFHGGLASPDPVTKPGAVRAPLRVYHGAADPHVPPAEVAAFEREMKAAGADYVLASYPGAVHSFTEAEAGDDPSDGVAYNKEADEKSWADLQIFLRDRLGGAPRR